MMYDVIRMSTGELRGVFRRIDHAKKLADELAEACNFSEQFAIVERRTIYVTNKHGGGSDE
jgi:hypothetical protein